MKTTYKYIEFSLIEPIKKIKTNIYFCHNIKSADLLAIIKWNPSWRQYCMFTIDNIVFSKGCLEDIIDFLNQLNKKK